MIAHGIAREQGSMGGQDYLSCRFSSSEYPLLGFCFAVCVCVRLLRGWHNPQQPPPSLKQATETVARVRWLLLPVFSTIRGVFLESQVQTKYLTKYKNTLDHCAGRASNVKRTFKAYSNKRANTRFFIFSHSLASLLFTAHNKIRIAGKYNPLFFSFLLSLLCLCYSLKQSLFSASLCFFRKLHPSVSQFFFFCCCCRGSSRYLCCHLLIRNPKEEEQVLLYFPPSFLAFLKKKKNPLVFPLIDN